MMKIKKETKNFVKDFQTALQKKKFSSRLTSAAAENVYLFPFTSLSVSFEIHSPKTISKQQLDYGLLTKLPGITVTRDFWKSLPPPAK